MTARCRSALCQLAAHLWLIVSVEASVPLACTQPACVLQDGMDDAGVALLQQQVKGNTAMQNKKTTSEGRATEKLDEKLLVSRQADASVRTLMSKRSKGVPAKELFDWAKDYPDMVVINDRDDIPVFDERQVAKLYYREINLMGTVIGTVAKAYHAGISMHITPGINGEDESQISFQLMAHPGMTSGLVPIKVGKHGPVWDQSSYIVYNPKMDSKLWTDSWGIEYAEAPVATLSGGRALNKLMDWITEYATNTPVYQPFTIISQEENKNRDTLADQASFYTFNYDNICTAFSARVLWKAGEYGAVMSRDIPILRRDYFNIYYTGDEEILSPTDTRVTEYYEDVMADNRKLGDVGSSTMSYTDFLKRFVRKRNTIIVYDQFDDKYVQINPNGMNFKYDDMPLHPSLMATCDRWTGNHCIPLLNTCAGTEECHSDSGLCLCPVGMCPWTGAVTGMLGKYCK